MIKTNDQLVDETWASLKNKWGIPILVGFVYMLFQYLPGLLQEKSTTFSWKELYDWTDLIVLFISGPLALGMAIFALKFSRNEEYRFEQLFEGFKNIISAIILYLLFSIFIILWTILLIVPGVIYSLAYSMCFYILADEPDINPLQALRKSKAMMYGYKKQLFFLCLRFFGLSILCVLTLGIGFLWLFPFMEITCANFYEEVKAKYMEKTIEI